MDIGKCGHFGSSTLALIYLSWACSFLTVGVLPPGLSRITNSASWVPRSGANPPHGRTMGAALRALIPHSWITNYRFDFGFVGAHPPRCRTMGAALRC